MLRKCHDKIPKKQRLKIEHFNQGTQRFYHLKTNAIN